MGYNIRLIIPLYGGDVLSGDGRAHTTVILEQIVQKWGGCTTKFGNGHWNPEGKDGEVVLEFVLVCDTSVGHWDTETREWWERLAAEIARDRDQECVFLSVTSECALLVNGDQMVRHLGE